LLIELADVQSPRHVENFLRYVDMGYYAGTVFHRVVESFVVQGGGVDRELRARPTLPPIENESRNALSNVRGSVAAARTSDPDSATSQFFINLEDNVALDASEEPGYTVFGRVKQGIAVADEIGRLPTRAMDPFPENVPQPLIAIRSIARFDEQALSALPEGTREAAIRERIMSAVEAQDHAQTLQWIDHYRAICGANEPEIALLEANTALALDNRARATFVLEEYFAVVEDTHPTYQEALASYQTLTPDEQATGVTFVTDCESPDEPVTPDGNTATLDEMIAAQATVREFVADSEAYLDCLAAIIDDEEHAAAMRNAAINEHNRMVAAMEALAEDFNTEIRTFKARE
jgi:peptidyl-prolyl cis-trans isomerase A (cyclophilin A)/peptidyl-prolyl cis-trans isomerase B (cyclophilin B)